MEPERNFLSSFFEEDSATKNLKTSAQTIKKTDSMKSNFYSFCQHTGLLYAGDVALTKEDFMEITLTLISGINHLNLPAEQYKAEIRFGLVCITDYGSNACVAFNLERVKQVPNWIKNVASREDFNE